MKSSQWSNLSVILFVSLCGRPHPSPGNLGHHRLSVSSLVHPAPQRWGSPSFLAIPAVLFPLPAPSPALLPLCSACCADRCWYPPRAPAEGFWGTMCLCKYLPKELLFWLYFPVLSLFRGVDRTPLSMPDAHPVSQSCSHTAVLILPSLQFILYSSTGES